LIVRDALDFVAPTTGEFLRKGGRDERDAEGWREERQIEIYRSEE
jgi:hypothetical protein